MSGYYYNISRGKWLPREEEDDDEYPDYLTGGRFNGDDSGSDNEPCASGRGLYDNYEDEEY